MAVMTAKRIDLVYQADQRPAIPVLEIMGGPVEVPGPVLRIHPERDFSTLARRWREETRFFSSLDTIVEHEAY